MGVLEGRWSKTELKKWQKLTKESQFGVEI